MYSIARSRGINTVSEFFDQDLSKKLAISNGQADIIHAHNVLAHVPDINSILQRTDSPPQRNRCRYY